MKLRYTLLLSSLLATNVLAGNDHVRAYVKIGPNSGRVNQSIPFQSWHYVAITNPYFTKNMTYTYVYKLCSEWTGCKMQKFTKTLVPQQQYIEEHIMNFAGVWPRGGSKQIWATTEILGEFTDSVTAANTLSVFY
jgi:hypothetical protein